jgi:hypothetical protein
MLGKRRRAGTHDGTKNEEDKKERRKKGTEPKFLLFSVGIPYGQKMANKKT